MLRRDEAKGIITKLPDSYPPDFFSIFSLFKILCSDY